MGQKSRTASVAAVMTAFLTRRTWRQAELARAVELSTEALRKILRELCESGVPLESEKSHPDIYWRVPRAWYPGGVLFRQEQVPDLLRQLTHAPASKARNSLLTSAVEQLPPARKLSVAAPVVARASSESEEEYLPVIEDAAARKVPVWMRYLTASRGGTVSERHTSVHAVEVGPPARFVAICHRSGELRWFRVDGIVRARADASERHRACDPRDLERFRGASLDGFKGAGRTMVGSFHVRAPESSWVANNLLEGMRAETVQGGIRVQIETSAVLRLARFVVGLGEAARPETAALATAVAELARGALDSAEGALREEEASSNAEGAYAAGRVSSDV